MTLISAQEASALLGVNVSTINKYRRDGRIEAVPGTSQSGRRVNRYRRADVLALPIPGGGRAVPVDPTKNTKGACYYLLRGWVGLEWVEIGRRVGIAHQGAIDTSRRCSESWGLPHNPKDLGDWPQERWGWVKAEVLANGWATKEDL